MVGESHAMNETVHRRICSFLSALQTKDSNIAACIA